MAEGRDYLSGPGYTRAAGFGPQQPRRPLPPPVTPPQFQREQPTPPAPPSFTPPSRPQPRHAAPPYQPRQPYQPAPRAPRLSSGNMLALAAGAVVVAASAAAVIVISRTPSRPPAAAAGSTAGPVSAVPGSNGNEYVAGPFTVTLTGIGPLPSRYDAVTESGALIPENCATVTVKNTSASFTGWAAPQVEFVKGRSLSGPVLETDPADPTGGSSGGSSDPLAPGQSQVLYACPQQVSAGTYVQAQLVTVDYGTPDEGTGSGTVVPLKY